MMQLRLIAVAVTLFHGAVAAAVVSTSASSASSSSFVAQPALPTDQNLRRHLQATTTSTIADLATADPDLSTLLGALGGDAFKDLVASLAGGVTSGITLFAPTNAAFAALLAGSNSVVANRVLTMPGYGAHLQNLIQLHYVVGDKPILAADLKTGDELTMANEETITVGAGASLAGPANINVTVTVTTPDIIASNGVIHKIDTVLLPSFWNLDVVTLAETSDIESLSTLKDLFLQLKDSPTAAQVLQVAKTLEVTMFAPTDEAFAELGESAIEAVTTDSALLLNVLQNHVVLGKVLARDDLVDGLSVDTLRNAPQMVSREEVLGGEEEVIKFGDAVVLEYVLANNGIIHTIQNVLLSADEEALLLGTAPPTDAAPSSGTTPAPVMTAPMAAPTVAPTAMAMEGANPTAMPVATKDDKMTTAPTTDKSGPTSMPTSMPSMMGTPPPISSAPATTPPNPPPTSSTVGSVAFASLVATILAASTAGSVILALV